jgi:hypothetical protein
VTEDYSDDKKTQKQTTYSYPPDVAKKIWNTVVGLHYVYTTDVSSTIRTKYTPYSDTEWLNIGGLCQPMFSPEVGPRVKGKFVLYHKEEIEWLEAFLESCKFMSGMSEVRWSATETVAQMWQRKCSL